LFCDKKPLYFAFADEGQRYYLSSMLQLGIDDYLWLALRKSGCQCIFSINPTAKGVELHIADQEAYQEYCSSSWLLSPDGYKGPTDIPMDPAKAAKWLTRQIDRKNGKCAIVIRLPVLARLFGGGANRKSLDELLKRFQCTKNPIVILSPATMTDSDLGAFLDPEGIFGYRSERSGSLCPELYDMIHAEAAVPIFHQLKACLGRRMLEPDVITFDRLKLLLEHIQFRRGEVWEESEFLDYANFIHRWWYRDSVRSTCPDLFRNARSYRDIYQSLTEPGGWKRLQDRMNGYKKRHGNKPVFIIDGPIDRQALEAKCLVTRDDPLAAKLARLTWPKELSGSFPDASAEALHRAQNRLTRPYTKPIRSGCREKLAVFLNSYETAQRGGDIDTMRRAMRAILFCAGTMHKAHSDGMDCDKFLNLHAFNLQQSEKYTRIWRTVRSAETSGREITDSYHLGLMGELDALEKSLANTDATLSIDPELLQSQSSGIPARQELEEIEKMLQKTLQPEPQEAPAPQPEVYDREAEQKELQWQADMY